MSAASADKAALRCCCRLNGMPGAGQAAVAGCGDPGGSCEFCCAMQQNLAIGR
jgi:hypothetical protein